MSRSKWEESMLNNKEYCLANGYHTRRAQSIQRAVEAFRDMQARFHPDFHWCMPAAESQYLELDLRQAIGIARISRTDE